MLGFETIGNATAIIHDKRPVLVTDPWIAGDPYFGSWGMSHEIPSAQMENILNCEYVWFSHGHPDHLMADSLDKLSNKKILLPDHFGGRINSELSARGINTRVLPSAEWVDISKNIKIMCLPDYNQDAVLLIAVNDNLIVNLNDSGARGYIGFIKNISQNFKKRYALKLNNYGNVDMLNIYDEDGNFITPACASKPSLVRQYKIILKEFNCNFALPFSCFHQLQREDSIWASKYNAPMSAHFEGFDMPGAELLPAFVAVDFEKDSVTELNPKDLPLVVKPPEEFGDNWADCLDKDDFVLCKDYFLKKEHLKKCFGFINLRVGGKDNFISLNKVNKTGITFDVPRASLMTSVKYQIFDDLLIGNFMRTTVHGVNELYPDFTPYVAKYADNGKAQSQGELKEYFKFYSKIDPIRFIFHRVFQSSEGSFRKHFSPQTMAFQISRKIYHFLK
jgi:hypothetical protein